MDLEKGKRKIRVLITTAMLKSADALGDYFNGLAEQLLERGHEVTVACNGSDYPNRPYPVFVGKDIPKLLKKRFDVIVAGVSAIDIYKPFLPFIKFKEEGKLILDYHGITPIKYVPRPGMKLQLIAEHFALRYLSLYADHIIAHSQYMADEVVRFSHSLGTHGNLKEKVKIFDLYIKSTYRMLDVEECKQKTGIKKGVLYVGRLERHKRIDFLIDAFAKLDYKDAKLLIVGNGSAENEIKEKIKKDKLEDKVKLLGKLSDENLLLYYNAADVVATASIHEGFCVPVIESYACGTPFVGTNIAALPCTIGKYGSTFEVNDLEGLANALKKYLDWSREERLSFRTQVVEYNKRFTRSIVLNSIADEIEALAWM
ncbi:MAG: glycosyltransferase family 4 protein [Thermoplasmata archaeon]